MIPFPADRRVTQHAHRNLTPYAPQRNKLQTENWRSALMFYNYLNKYTQGKKEEKTATGFGNPSLLSVLMLSYAFLS